MESLHKTIMPNWANDSLAPDYLVIQNREHICQQKYTLSQHFIDLLKENWKAKKVDSCYVTLSALEKACLLNFKPETRQDMIALIIPAAKQRNYILTKCVSTLIIDKDFTIDQAFLVCMKVISLHLISCQKLWSLNLQENLEEVILDLQMNACCDLSQSIKNLTIDEP